MVAEWDRVKRLEVALVDGARRLYTWWSAVTLEQQRLEHRWIPRDTVAQWVADKPELDADFFDSLDHPQLAELLEAQPAGLGEALTLWRADITATVQRRNQVLLTQEPLQLADFFQTVEKTALTAEQIHAVVCFDNRVQVVASAGSGKTSTMVAKAGYALKRKVTTPDRILMLAFNTKAAKEMKDRIRGRLGDDAKAISAKTFHSFGLEVIGHATGRKPALSRAADDDGGLPELRHIIETLAERDRAFGLSWGLFRTVFARELPPFESLLDQQLVVQDARGRGLLTRAGQTVRSQEERMIADWLFHHGVNYVYERDYEHDTTDGTHRQYQPDFYYPDIDVYHEHFALNAAGEAPPKFLNYLDGVQWKRDLHARNGTSLIETTSATVRDGSAFAHLAGELEARGVTLDPRPRPAVGNQQLVEERALLSLVRAFLTHSKGNRLTDNDLTARVHSSGASPVRAELFLQLFLPVRAEWNRRLRDSGTVDYDDMINHATDLIEGGYELPYDVVMVDEWQDASIARASLIRALVSTPGRYLFAVGDDWQSINRFAGADPTVMTEFHQRFGPGEALKLERTFRSPQALCDIAGAFVTKNPQQLRKQVTSHQTPFDPAVKAVAVPSTSRYPAVIGAHLDELDRTEAQRAPAERDNQPMQAKATVLILGRYRKTRDTVGAVLERTWRHLQVEFSTMHAAKGREADHVVIIDLVAGGFPSVIKDDPLLGIAMPGSDTYPFADERRLFYVALTRSRRSVLLLTALYQESPFLMELIADSHTHLQTPDGDPVTILGCPRCDSRMKPRDGRRGPFWGCSAYPRCRGTRNWP